MFPANVTLPVVSVKVTVSALTAPVNVVPPDCVIVITSNALVAPIAPVIVIVADPESKVKSRAVLSLSTVLPNENKSLVVVRATLELKVTAPVYVCVPVEETLAPRLDVPLTLNIPIAADPPIAPSRSKLPVIVKFCAPLIVVV